MYVLILGATSAIAAEVAQICAERGDRLHLVGRDAHKLAAVASRCSMTEVSTERADFADIAGNEAVIRNAFRVLGQVDTVLIAHGVLGDQLATEHSFEQAEQTLHVNFDSVVSLLIPVANRLEVARAGRIAVITSVAGDRGRPRNYTYGAAKGALNVYLQGLRSRLYPSGVSVTTLKLGPVDTPMTHGHRKHALFGQPVPVARAIVRAIDQKRREVYIPRFWRLVMPFVRRMPEVLLQRLRFLSGR
jgi:decaprenylphospho-beta-D-erythro-pentofuranosid-2-ulose 2-reductase